MPSWSQRKGLHVCYYECAMHYVKLTDNIALYGSVLSSNFQLGINKAPVVQFERLQRNARVAAGKTALLYLIHITPHPHPRPHRLLSSHLRRRSLQAQTVYDAAPGNKNRNVGDYRGHFDSRHF